MHDGPTCFPARPLASLAVLLWRLACTMASSAVTSALQAAMPCWAWRCMACRVAGSDAQVALQSYSCIAQ